MEVYGLPLHPLVVHATVVFVPLAALGGIVVSLWTWARDRYGLLVLAAALLGLVATFVAEQSGEQFYDSFPAHSPAMDTHLNIASPLIYWVLGMFVGQVVLMGGWFVGRRVQPPSYARILHWVGVALSIVFGIISVIWTIRAGHAGATAVWGS